MLTSLTIYDALIAGKFQYRGSDISSSYFPSGISASQDIHRHERYVPPWGPFADLYQSRLQGHGRNSCRFAWDSYPIMRSRDEYRLLVPGPAALWQPNNTSLILSGDRLPILGNRDLGCGWARMLANADFNRGIRYRLGCCELFFQPQH